MKNLFFALAFILVGHLGIASNSNSTLESFEYLEDFGTCTITVNFYENGELIGSSSFDTFASSELDCRIQAAEIRLLFR